jgi:hypothetical protein
MSLPMACPFVSADGAQPSHVAHAKGFEFCFDEQCVWSSTGGTHLLISKHQINLAGDKDAAVAVSYAWGQFEHSERQIGHNMAGGAVFLTLGAEWDTADFANCFVRLSAGRGGCWIDQLCMPQKDEELRSVLAGIPVIYRSIIVIWRAWGGVTRREGGWSEWGGEWGGLWRESNPKQAEMMFFTRNQIMIVYFM